MSPKSRRLAKAVEAFGELPPEVAALGKPLSVHPPSAMSRFGGSLARFRAGTSDPAAKQKRAAALAIALPVFGALFLLPYLTGVPLGDGPPEGWLLFPAFGLLFGLIAGGYWWYLSRTAADGAPAPPRPRSGASMPGFILYPDALVQVRDGEFTVICWEDVETLESPAAAPYWRVTDRHGRQIQLSYWVEDEAATIETTVEWVTAVLLPVFLRRIEEGKKVMFGPFGLSKRFVYYKQKKASWDEVTRMRMVTGRMRGLQIFCGGLFAWCFYNLSEAPNGQIAIALLPHVAPARLLRPT